MVTMSTHVPGTKDFKDEVSKLVYDLTQAIAEGNLSQCRNISTELGKMRAKVEMATVDNRFPTIALDVVLQRRGEQRGTIRIHAQENSTFRHLKHMMSKQYNLPVGVQRWVHERQFPKDDVTLASLEIKDGDKLGLYIMSESFANQPDESASSMEVQLDEARVSASDSLSSVDDGAQAKAAPPQRPQGAPAPRPPGGPPAPPPAAPVYEPVMRPQQPPPRPPENVKWSCDVCTLLNEPTRPSCEMCGANRPEDFQVPEDYEPSEEEKRRMEQEMMMTQLFEQTQQQELFRHQAYIQENLERIAQDDANNYVTNDQEFECQICFTEVEAGQGAVLRNCVHEFCVPCLRETVINSEGAEVKCPFTDGQYQCDAVLQHREIQALVSAAEYEKYLNRGVRIAEGQEKNSFHCKTPNCQGWCIYEDEVNFFRCPICSYVNCLTCKVIHEGRNCQEYQDDLKRSSEIDTEHKATLEGIQAMIQNGEAMNCPGCGVLLQKKEGCDWMRCSMCMTELCWATRGPRWGPKGTGDTSGGCKCGVRGPCTPRCQNCH